MTTALIVDDSKVDRELVSALLKGKTSLDIRFASNGRDALRQIGETPPDIIVTDLHMPEVNGLKLVKTVHADYSTIPVVLVTANGSEDLAVQALKEGAASYVPKTSLARDLVPTVMHVLAVARTDHSRKEVQRCWSETLCSFELPNDYNLISPLVAEIVDVVKAMQLFDDMTRVQLAMALEEAISNALYHGNLELTSEQLNSIGYDLSDPDSENIVDTRRESSPYKERSVRVKVKLTRESARFTIRDDGPGFDHRGLPTPEEVVASGELSGRGLAQMRLFCDEISFNEAGNEVVLVKST